MKWLALDIGGANVKAADGLRFAESRPFALWRHPDALAATLRTIIAEAPESDHLAVTMTGELADCFSTKADGVRYILSAVGQASDRRHTRVYLNNGMLVTAMVAGSRPLEAAAANWHALGRYALRFASPAAALLIDVGSTTCDIVPLLAGKVAAAGRSDTERLLLGELVYTGVERSPLCAVLREAPLSAGPCPVAQEYFASMRDAYLLLDRLPEVPVDTNTADGKSATKPAARLRLARMICADKDSFSHRDSQAIAQAAFAAQTELVAAALQKVLGRLSAPPENVVLSGHGDFLSRAALEAVGLNCPTLSLAEKLGPDLSRCATAHALAVLAREAAGV